MTAPGLDALLSRLERDSLIVAAAMTVLAAAVWPERPQRAFGVVGGVALIAVSYRGIRAGVDSLLRASDSVPEGAPPLPPSSTAARVGFVKFFTRHAILAVGAYVMMARFEFDPMAMLAGVTAPVLAAAVELVRTVRVRKSGPHSRSS